MTRSLSGISASASLSATITHTSDVVGRSVSGLVRHSAALSLEDGIEVDQANRAWDWTGDLSVGSNIVLDLTTFSGFDLFGANNDGKDLVGQDMAPFEEIVAILISNNNESDEDGILAVEPDATDGWTPIGTHAPSNDGGLRGGGFLLKACAHATGWPVTSSSKRIRLTASESAVNYTISILGRNDDEGSSSSSSSSSSSTSSSSLSTSSSSQSSSSRSSSSPSTSSTSSNSSSSSSSSSTS